MQDLQNFKSVYDQRYSGDYRARLSGFEVARWKAMEHFASRVLRLSAGGQVLDYGAGTGLHLGLWKNLFPDAKLHFCDISSVAMEKFCTKSPRFASTYRLIRDGRADFEDDSFEIVVSVEVMEHVEDLTAYLRDIHRVLKPGGYFVWTTPCANAGSIEHVFSKLTGRIDPTAEGYRRWSWEDPTHVRRLRSSEAEAVLAACGFDKPIFRFRSHLFSFVCTYCPPRKRFRLTREQLMTLDYSLFRLLPNGASMIGAARAIKGAADV